MDIKDYKADSYFKDTYSKLNDYPKCKTTVLDVPEMYDECDNGELPEVEFVKLGTLEAAELYTSKNNKVVIHNFANPYKPCWGVVYDFTQEEIIFRQTNLAAGLSKELYPITNKVLYTENVTVFKDRIGIKNKLFEMRQKPYTIDVVSSAALHSPILIRNKYQKCDRDATSKLVYNTLMASSESKDVDIFITGAWGCGIFENPIEEMCEIWHNEIHRVSKNKRFVSRVKKIVFAIPDDKIYTFRDMISPKTTILYDK